MMNRKTIVAFGLGVALTSGASVALQSGLANAQVGANQPRMQAALSALSTARSELQAGASNKGGHRLKAIGLVNQAIVEVQEGMAVAD